MGLWANGQAGRRCGKAVCRPGGKACPFPLGGDWLFHRQSGRFPHFHSAGLILGDDTRTARRQQAVQRQRHIPRRHQQPPDKDAAADKAGKDEVQKEQGDPTAQRAASRYDPEPQPPDPKRQPAEDPEPEIVQFPVLYAGGAEDAVQQRGQRRRQDGLAEKVL